MANQKTIFSFYKRKTDDTIDNKNQQSKRAKASTSNPEQHQNQPEENIHGTLRLNVGAVDLSSLERDPAKRKHMWDYPVNEREQVRRTYLSLGPYQIHLKEYPGNGPKTHLRRFQYSWFNIFPNWLEYPPTTDAAYCFLCYLFGDKPNVRNGADAFTVKGFKNWKKVNDGRKCAFLKHISCAHHKDALVFSENLLNQSTHTENIIEKRSKEKVLKNRIRLKATFDIVRWLTFQACAFRGHDETQNSKNRGNFLEMLKLLALYNDELAKVALENAPYNSKYTTGSIQKEILGIIANKVRKYIRSEVGDSYFCVMVDESRDESKKEQMAIVLRFVDKDGVIRERFLGLVHVSDTTSLTLKTSLWTRLLKYEFDTSKIRGQGYDGASNMRGEWNGLQALVLKDCPFAYYIHCFAHRLQLALVAASREVITVHQFFSMTFIINVICASSKRHDELQKAKSIEIKRLLEFGEIETGKGANQVGTLKRAGDTRWGSHFYSVCNLLKMFDATCVVLESIIEDGSYPSQRGDVDSAYVYLKGFEFVFILHLVKEVMGMTDILSQALQKKTQDIVNAIELVSTTKRSLNDLRNNGWDRFLETVLLFSQKHGIDIPDMNALYKSSRYSPRKQDNQVTIEHYYRVDLFICILDKQLLELENRFNDHAMELLTLGSSLFPIKDPEFFFVDKICLLVEKYSPSDFTEQEMNRLRYQLELLKLIRLILTLPVSTATTERGFSAMKIFKNRLRNKMSDDFLAYNLVVYIEKEIAETFDSESIIDDFKAFKGRRAEL